MGLKAHLFLCAAIFIVLNDSAAHRLHTAAAPPKQLMEAYHSILNLHIRNAHARIDAYRQGGGRHPFMLYLQSLAATLELGVTSDPVLYERHSSLEDRLLDEIDALPEDDPYHHYLKAEVRLQWSFVKLKYGNELAAYWTLKQAYNASKKLRALHPAFEPGQKTFAVMQVLFGSVPDQYQWITGLLGLKGDVETGLHQLEKIYNANGLFAVEAGIWTSLVQAYLLHQFDESTHLAFLLQQQMPQSLLVAFLTASVLIKNAESEKALQIIEKYIPMQDRYLPFPQLLYMTGEINLQKGHYEKAIRAYSNFLAAHKGPNQVKDAYFKIAISYHLLDLETQAEQYWKHALEKGAAKIDVDKNADQILKSGRLPQKQLARARYHTDGGYFTQALEILEDIRPNDLSIPKDHTEYLYRYARLYDKLQAPDKAQVYYERVIDVQESQPWYFAPNACLQLAYLDCKQGNTGRAKTYLRTLDQYSGYPYAGSIRKKAALLEKKMDESGKKQLPGSSDQKGASSSGTPPGSSP